MDRTCFRHDLVAPSLPGWVIHDGGDLSDKHSVCAKLDPMCEPQNSVQGGPTQPATYYLSAVAADVAAQTAAAQPPPSPYRGAPAAAAPVVAAAIAELAPDLERIASSLHADPECAFEEHRAVALLTEVLTHHGHAVTSGAYDVETAFETRFHTPGFTPGTHRRIGICAEYDALPGLGHACGHNIIAASGVGTYLAVVAALQGDLGIEGEVVLYGTPAEEGHSGKEYMIRGGAFADCDAVIMLHPFGMDVAEHVWVGRRTLDVTFHGISAHASAQPFMGRNALDAASLAYQALGLLRQQMPPSDRLHAIITDGGHRASIIPDTATLALNVRSTMPETLQDLSTRVADIMRGAALMTGCGVDISWDAHPPTLPVRNNHALAGRYADAAAQRGRTALPAGVLPESVAASTDFGNVSHLVPGIHPMLAIAEPDVALHTAEFATVAGDPQVHAATADGVYGLALTALDFLADEELAAAVRAEFASQGGALTVADYFPEDH